MPSSTSPPDRVVAVGVPVPGLGLLSYRVPDAMPMPPKGARVVVPLGRRVVVGCVVNTHAEIPKGAALRDLSDVLDADPFLPAVVVDLALWVGEYYASGPGDALAMAMPPAARGGRSSAYRTVNVATLVEADVATPKAKRQADVVELLHQSPEGLTGVEIVQAGGSAGVLRTLVKQGVVRLSSRIRERDPFTVGLTDAGGSAWALASSAHDDRGLTEEQAAAFHTLEGLAASGEFKAALLHGVTGSGKTEIYLRLARSVIALGRRVLVLVPEIGLTPAAAGLFRARFGSRVAIQHSGLSTGERHDQWQRIRRGEVDVVVGTRSAVFAPLERVGLIVVDEEHDTAYKQEESPRYHGRDVAVVRAKAERALVVMGTATPSLEAAANARAGRYELIRLTKRVLDRPMAAVRIIDMRQEFAAHGADVTLSAPLIEAIGARLARREQTVVLLNRRGFASSIFCRSCGTSMECPHCSVTLTFHRAARRLRCHYCNYSTPVPAACPTCGGEVLEHQGFGTERIESDLRATFPDARITRVDRDTIRKRGALAQALAAVAAGQVDILVGTQMIAKGHDFPAVTLVGVVSADVGLGVADFRSAERTFQLITQVVGRAGRGETPGEAVVQSMHPDHYSIRAAAAQDYDAFYTRESDYRERLHYPPVVGLINVVVKGRTMDRAMTDALDLAGRVRRMAGSAKVIGPAPAALSKVKDEYRVQFFLKSTRRRAMREALDRALAARADLRKRVIVDVDPLSVI